MKLHNLHGWMKKFAAEDVALAAENLKGQAKMTMKVMLEVPKRQLTAKSLLVRVHVPTPPLPIRVPAQVPVPVPVWLQFCAHGTQVIFKIRLGEMAGVFFV